MNRGGQPRVIPGTLDSVSLGYITIPNGAEREAFIEDCMRRGKVMVFIEGGAFKQDVLITREALQEVRFPDEPGKIGSPVVVASSSYTDASFVVGTLITEDDTPSWHDNTYRFRKVINGVATSILVDPTRKQMRMDAQSKDGATIDITSTGSDSSTVNMVASGKSTVEGWKEVESKSYEVIKSTLINKKLKKDKIDQEVRETKFDLDGIYYKQVYNPDDKVTNSFEFTKEGLKFVYNTNKETVTINDDMIEITFGENNDFIRMTKDKIEIKSGKLVEVNGGSNRGVMNIAQMESFIQAVAKDLLAAMSGASVSQWMASEMPKMEDKNFTH